jgi:hypothetical protein
LIIYQLKDADLFISFQTSLKSSKLKFEAKTYTQNMKLHHVEKEHRNFFGSISGVSSQIGMASVQGCRALHYISKKSKIITLEFKAKKLRTKYESGEH